jgi:hypothetical protein
MSRADLTAARAIRDQMHRAMRACAVDLEQTGRLLEESLERLRERQAARETTQQPAVGA